MPVAVTKEEVVETAETTKADEIARDDKNGEESKGDKYLENLTQVL